MQQGTQNPQGTSTPTVTSKPNLILIGIVVIAAIFLLPRLFNNNNNATVLPTAVPSIPQQQNPSTNNANISLGTPVSATGIDRNGCASSTTNSFATNDSIYVVAPNSNVPQGTTLFVRLYRDNNAIEDAPQITADKDYVQNCINFVFQPTGKAFTPGSYEAQFYINGNAASSVTFNVQ